MKKTQITIVLVLLSVCFANAQIISQWRGENRDGIYNEQGLLKEWPQEGPELLWANDSLPKGYSSPAIDGETIYITGLIDTIDYLLALDINGTVKWQTPYGRAFMESFQDSRSTPTIDGDLIYVQSGWCDIACVNKNTGELKWKVEAFDKYEGKTGVWGYSESLLVVDDKVLFTVGGHKTTMVALNKLTGDEIWQSPTLNDTTGYSSPIIIEKKGKKIAVNVMANNVFGINVKDGSIRFVHNYSEIDDDRAFALWNSPSASRINTNTPVFFNDEIYVTSGYNHSGVKYKLDKKYKNLEVVWVDSVLDVHHGGIVLVDGYIYGANWINNGNGNWCCINWETGAAEYETKWENKGSIIYNDGMLYCYEEKRGNIALVHATPEEFKIVSEFKITKGKGPHWSHLVIKDGILYVRHENALLAYNIKTK